MGGKSTSKAIEARYQTSFGRIAGYLPRNRRAAEQWHADFVAKAKARTDDHVPSVAALEKLLNDNKTVHDLVAEMIKQAAGKGRVKDIPELLKCLDRITTTAPEYRLDPAERVFFPMSTLFVHMMNTDAGVDAFRNQEFNAALLNILTEWCAYLDSPESRHVLTEDETGWLCQAAYEQNKLYEFVIPDPDALYGGFTSYNDFFHRRIKPEFRPNGARQDELAVISPNDGSVVRWLEGVKKDDDIMMKGQPYSLQKMLNGSEYVERFVGGTVFQSFLSGANYHRWHAPVDGVIKHIERVPGLMFSELQMDKEDDTAGTLSQGYQASVNTRGLVFIESTAPRIGMVCVVPVGITEISSVRFTPTLKAGDKVTRGDELGYFSYGGSSMCLVFEKGAIDHFTVPNNTIDHADDGAPIFVNGRIARAKAPTG
ncbi:phosphatidylserine decarboxylase family protein [Streptomyces sp. ISL-11]|uniref:phosphatidylserine decarboxylase family protein n=1 Tax=Streptomyces sp. ISL-11 TaxID=2819174 RepID=UPI001BE62706|nr:phosphatidylserine decarboxylase family protein [Streptomyces sp. ISL-11]MBT2386444.1 phophatidylserine decarboxylase associated domain-containing protein [Streptomyces sp. ISL-11]